MASRSEFELLAPAGNWSCAKAAVENGADAIYFGLETGFNARARADNFTLEDLPALMQFLHLRGVRGYTTLNTLVFTDELARFQEHVIALAAANVDAVLVQDLGAARLVRAICPELVLHASTQMTLSSSDGLAVAAELGLERVVLPRELSVSEIETMRQGANETTNHVSFEAFVHGALCVAYSGQCLTSESLGGRSANRGQCAQACRLPYEVVCDGHDVDLGDVQYLLSPQDLAAHALLPDLIAAGVRSFKIEGRLKTPEYVANVTRHYRAALDSAIVADPFALSPQAIEELELSFSRGFSTGWLGGIDHKMLVPGRTSAKRGIRVGAVTDLDRDRVTVTLERNLAVGDGVVFAGDRSADKEQGGRIIGLVAAPHSAQLKFHRDQIDFSKLYVGQSVWKTDDPQLTKRLRATYTAADPIRRVAVDFQVTARVGHPLHVVATADSGARCEVTSEDQLPLAERHVVTEDHLRKQLGRLGASVYQIRNLTLQVTGQPMAPMSLLSQVRQAVIQQLNQSLANDGRVTRTIDRSALVRLKSDRLKSERQAAAAHETSSHATSSHDIRLHVLCRSLEQIAAVEEVGVASIYAELQDIRQHRDAVETAHAAGYKIYLATPRIEKPGETGIFRAMEKHGADGILVRNLGGLRYFRAAGLGCIADFSLNAANELTVDVLRDWGAERVTVSYDLNRDQIMALIQAAASADLEVVIHQHMPMFHMEHCVFCAVLSPGTNKTNCGRPCDVHQVKLRDRVGMEHPLQADVGCRNTLYNAVPQSSAEICGSLIAQGVRHLRIELLAEDAQATKQTINTYRRLLAGEISGERVWKELQAANRVGVTRGTLEERRNPLAIL